MEAYISFRDPIVDSEETDFYVVLEGSTLTHVTGARSSEGRLGFTVPGMFPPSACPKLLWLSTTTVSGH